MKNFIFFIAAIFSVLLIADFLRKNEGVRKDSRPVIRVFASSSFISQWGPGPSLKENFEKTCDCVVEYHNNADSTILVQNIKAESRTGGVDVAVGFDQYDLEMATQGIEWKKIVLDDSSFEDHARATMQRTNLIPYDWSPLSFVFRFSEWKELPNSIDDLLRPEFKGQIAMEDPRTASPGLQFLLWLIQIKGEEKAFEFLKVFNSQLHSYAPSWSASYGLFQKGIVKSTFSYVTSPIYHVVEDKNRDVVAVQFSEGHPVQYEFVGVPATCKSCDLATKFVTFLIAPESQKIIMEKNYMLPVIKSVTEGTLFAEIPKYKAADISVIPTVADRERILKKWAALRRGE